ncbi:MAG TPA: hypothetical protein VNN17_06730 [Terriglobia bacterium]|nr:hypothetical protein [Terriglobia bacterium]
MNHYAAPDFWVCYERLPTNIRQTADRAFALLKADPRHPSLHLKKVGEYWSVRVGLHYRAVGKQLSDGVLWFWIGTHSEYNQLIG